MKAGEILKQRLDELTPSSTTIQPTTESFDHVELTDEETNQAIDRAKKEKYYRLKAEEYRRRLVERQRYPEYSAQQLMEFFGMQYEIDEQNIGVVEKLCLYFSNDNRFKGDLSKGIFLMGPVGVGKTSIMKFFMKNQRMSYRVESCREVESKADQYGPDYLNECSFNRQIANNSDPFGHQVIGYCFDDLGTESNSRYFGKEKNVMAEIILNRYDNRLDYVSTHITTNLSADKIKENYGTRVVDRVREMFNVIQFDVKAKSRRE